MRTRTRALSLFGLCVLCLSLGCRRGPTSAELVKKLSDPNPQVREAAALSLRTMAAADAAAVGDVGEHFWRAKLATFRPGTSDSEIFRALGPGHPGEGNGGYLFQRIKLDAYWSVTAELTEDTSTGKIRLRRFDALERHAPEAEVGPPPAGFSGKWVSHYINGTVANEHDFVGGVLVRITDYYDNGQVRAVTPYAPGFKEDGMAVSYNRNGTKATEGRYVAGKRSGPWVEYDEKGKSRYEATYVDGEAEGITLHRNLDGTMSRMDFHAGKETGQAAWDEQGKLIYARESAADAGAAPAFTDRGK
jgi:antitoxin component YwqK of YwqJK toxin-antitoxin module